MDPDTGGPKTYGSDGFGSGYATLLIRLAQFAVPVSKTVRLGTYYLEDLGV
jgi:hypothetical protein